MRVSFGKVDITPKDYLGRFLAGYAPIPRCAGKFDDIHARATLIEDVVLGNVQKKLLVIAMDFVMIPIMFTDYIKEKIQDKYKIHPNQIFITATHTHKSLDMSNMYLRSGGYTGVILSVMLNFLRGDDRYKVWIAKRIVEMVGDMLSRLQPARIAWTKQTIEDHIIYNRRHPNRSSKSRMCIIAFKQPSSRKLIGFIASFGMHPTTLSYSVNKLSADYPGVFVRHVEEASNGEIEAVYFTGPCGDLNPITTIGLDFEALPEKTKKGYHDTQRGSYKDTKRLGTFLADKALDIARSIPDDAYFDSVDFKSYVKTFWIPMKDFTRYFSKNWLQNRFVHSFKRYVMMPIPLLQADVHEPNFTGYAVKHRGWCHVVTYTTVQYIKIVARAGDKQAAFSIVGVPGELFEDFTNRIYDRTPEGKDGTFIFEIANDYVGYLFPLNEYIETSGYEPMPTFSPVCGTYVVKNYFKLLREIDEDVTGGYF